MATPRKLPSGKWNLQVLDYTDSEGKRHVKSFTADTKAEVVYQASLWKNKKEPNTKQEITLYEAIDKYIELSEVLSPTTLSSYRKIQQYGFQDIMQLEVSELNDCTIQAAINTEAKRKSERTGRQISPKTVKNEWGVISSALRTVCNKSFNIRLPKIQHKNEDLPSPQLIMDLIKDTPVELPCMLAMCMSLRMSEIRGLMCSSVKGNVLFIDQVVVDVDGVATRKTLAKTDKSIRKLQIPQYIQKRLKSLKNYQEYLVSKTDSPLVPMTRNQIHHYFTRLMKDNDIDMSFHDLRHVYASVCLNILNIPEKITMDIGGWATPSVMKSVYSQSFSEARRDADIKINNYFSSLL